jgi:hypothetical protein
METYKNWTIDELCTKLQVNRKEAFNLNVEITAIVDVLEGRMKEMKEVMYTN